MGLKKTFLQLPLNSQIYLSIMLIIIANLLIIIFLSQVFTITQCNYLKSRKKEYFSVMFQNIMESNVYFMNLCILQYENLIKTFNYQLYLYLHDEDILINFAMLNVNNIFQFDTNKINLILDPSKNITNNYSYSNTSEILYIYYYSDNKSILPSLGQLVITNGLSYLNQIKGIRSFRIPFYGDLFTMGEFLISFSKYNALFTLNCSKILDVIELFGGDMDKYMKDIRSKEDTSFNYYKKFFDSYVKKELPFIDLMYELKYNIFSDYKNIEDENIKEDYIRNQSIFFQSINFKDDTTLFYDKWNPKTTRFQSFNNLIYKYLDFLFLQLSNKISLYSIPFNHDTSDTISINLCYFFLLKQIVYLNITSDDIGIKFDKNFLDNIYNEISNKGNISINDCKIEKYYSKNKDQLIPNGDNFKKYYDLEYIYNSYIYLLNKKDSNSIIYENKFSYPNYACLKDLFPNFFSFQQIDFYSFSFGNQINKMINSSNQIYSNIRFLMILILVLSWIIFLFIFMVITTRIIKQVTEPIIKLTEIIDLNNLNEKIINENIFEYKSDDDINEFFLMCKKLIDGEIKDNNFKNKENIEINSNNNMIINNKMILELIENQKSLNTADKEIFLYRQAYINDMKNKKHKTYKSSNNNRKEKVSQGQQVHFNLMKVNSSSKNIDNQLINSNNDLYSEVEENGGDPNNMKFYENLLNMADYIYNGRDKEKTNKRNKLRMNISHTSIVNPNMLKLGSASNISINNKNDNDNKNIRKSKYITYSWYAYAKKAGLFGK